MVVVNGGALDSVVGLTGGALDFSVEARRGGFSIEAQRGGDSVVGLAGVVVVGFSVDFSVEARCGGDSVVGLAGVVVVGFSVDFRLGLGFCRLGFLGFAASVSVHSVVVVDGLGLGLGSRRGGWKRVWVFGGGAVGLSLEVCGG
ncbi:hypothetical protein FCV25MIE_30038 [Fagus crenata]